MQPMPSLVLHHRSDYRYARPVRLSVQTVRLCPGALVRTPVLDYAIEVEPASAHLSWKTDAYGNRVLDVLMPQATNRFAVQVRLVANPLPFNPFDFAIDASAQDMPPNRAARYSPHLLDALAVYCEPPVNDLAVLSDYLSAFEQQFGEPPHPTVEYLLALARRIKSDIGYQLRHEIGTQTPGYTLAWRSGACRDSAWLMVALLRLRGLAARFVSGYLLPQDAQAEQGPAPISELHAWAEVYLPGAGWIGFDTTSGLLTSYTHIALACGPDPQSCAPIEGSHEPTDVSFEHDIRIERLG
jgi:transglutaminase-like putative cysteine protease